MANAINWFEIPVKNFERARIFYETILGTPMHLMEASGIQSAFFPADLKSGKVGGCIIAGAGYEPSNRGALVYLNGGDDLQVILSRVAAAGGSVLVPKMSIGSNGFMAQFEDCEGNRVGLHSRN